MLNFEPGGNPVSEVEISNIRGPYSLQPFALYSPLDMFPTRNKLFLSAAPKLSASTSK
jgi:hypothetical protein